MSNIKICWVLIIIVCLFFAGSSGFAQGPETRPPGWDKGEKTGWNGDLPPGLEKKRESGDGGSSGNDDDNSGDDNSGEAVSSDDDSGDKGKKKDKKKKKKEKQKNKK